MVVILMDATILDFIESLKTNSVNIHFNIQHNRRVTRDLI